MRGFMLSLWDCADGMKKKQTGVNYGQLNKRVRMLTICRIRITLYFGNSMVFLLYCQLDKPCMLIHAFKLQQSNEHRIARY